MINRMKLRRLVESKGPDAAMQDLVSGLRKGILPARDFSLQELAESFVLGPNGESVGAEWIRSLGPQKSGGLLLAEAASGMDLSRFSNITGQIMYTRMMEAYGQAEFQAAALCDSYQTNFNGEKIPGITGINDSEDPQVAEGMPYGQTGFGEDYVETPATTKRGIILSVTKETIFFDRTNLVLQQAGSVGEVLARRKEKLLWDAMLGITNSYKWRGTSYNTYQTATPWINKQSGVNPASADWTMIDTAEQLFAEMLDPNTSEPIVVNPTTIVCMPARANVFRRIINATNIESRTQSAAVVTHHANPIQSYAVIPSVWAYRRLIANSVSASNAKDYWLFGDFKKAFAWQYNWPLTVVQAPSNSEPEFTQDIVLRWKASERGSVVVKEPRAVVQSYNS